MAYRVAKLQAWSESLTDDGDRPWQGAPPHAAEGEAMDVIFCSVLELVTVQCEFDIAAALAAFTSHPDGASDAEEHPRTRQGTQRRLYTEARRFECGCDWRGDNMELARRIAEELRHKAAALPKQPRGRQSGSNPARTLVNAVVAELRDVLATWGEHRWAAAILAPGRAPQAWDNAGGRPTGLSTVEGIATALAEAAGIELPPGAIKRAVDDVRRAERRRAGSA